MPPLRIILAISDDGYIADANGKIPWHISYDLKWFKMNTLNSTIGMGRKTWDSLKYPLPNRHHIVLSRTDIYSSCSELEQCYFLKHFEKRMREENGWIIGGAAVAKQLARKGTIMVLTHVHTNVGEGIHMPLPPMKCLWKSKEMTRSGYSLHMTINKCI
jgi:dihydrofolate reductase